MIWDNVSNSSINKPTPIQLIAEIIWFSVKEDKKIPIDIKVALNKNSPKKFPKTEATFTCVKKAIITANNKFIDIQIEKIDNEATNLPKTTE